MHQIARSEQNVSTNKTIQLISSTQSGLMHLMSGCTFNACCVVRVFPPSLFYDITVT